jgi:Tol biopolymer transport system component/tRNA A-37 threonylcarbamoyl transferase component Bud32
VNASRLTEALADRYRIERELGQGGMATVYLAQDLKHDRKVALKVLRPELAAVIGAERFLSEIRTTANLQHPHILPLFDSGEADGFLFYVMPFIEGETIRARLDREKQLPIPDALRIATEVAGALDYAHRRGVIHRDIKPENILLHDGSALVADFGIALAASKAGGTRMTETGMSLGTPHYMSPEQAMGEREITARSDVYALGAVTYEMLLGEPPFTGPTAQSIVAKVLSERPARMATRRERVAPEVEQAILTALEKLPADRFASAAEFAIALRTPVTGGVTGHTLAPAAPRRVDWRVAAAAGLLVGAAATAFLMQSRDQPENAAGAGGRTQLTFNGRSVSPAISPDGDYVAFVDQRCPRGTFNPCTYSVLVQGRGSDRPVVILDDMLAVGAPRFTHDGASLVVAGRLDAARSGLYVVPRLGGVPRQVGPAGVFDTHARGDSALLLRAGPSGRQAIVIPLSSGVVSDSVKLPEGPVDGMGWSPDGRLLALVTGYEKLTIVRRDGTVADSLLGPFRSTVRWTPDGTGVLIFRALPVKEDDLVFHAVADDGRLTREFVVRVPAIQTLLLGAFDVARRSGQVALTSGGINFDLWTFDINAGAGPAKRRTSGTTWYGQPSITPDGKRLLYMRGDGSGDNLYELSEADVEEALTAERYPGIGAASVSADGRFALFGHSIDSGQRFGVMDIASRQTKFFVTSGMSTNDSPVVIGDTVVFIAADARSLRKRSLSSGQEQRLDLPDSMTVLSITAKPVGDSISALVVTPSGTRVAVSALSTWSPTWLHIFAPDEGTGALSWTNGGEIHFWLWPSGDETPGVYGIASSGGRPSRMRALPLACNVPAMVVAVAAPRGVCNAVDFRGDVWLLNVPGVTR